MIGYLIKLRTDSYIYHLVFIICVFCIFGSGESV